MTHHRAPRLALALLERLVPDSEALAGDLVEELDSRQSRVWFWWQVLAAIVTAWVPRGVEIRPLRLVDLQPADAVERSRRMALRFRPVTLNGNPMSDVGGLGFAIFAALVTFFAPDVWWLLVASLLAGIVLGIVIIDMRSGTKTAGPTNGPLSIRSNK